MTTPTPQDGHGRRNQSAQSLLKPTNPMSVPATCRHKSGPDGYIQKLDWLERMSKLYRQEQCNNYGLWVIWRRK